MKHIRHKCFETNSSSTHSLVVTKDFYSSDGKYKNRWGIKLKKSNEPIYDYETVRGAIVNKQTRKDPYNVLYVTGGEFGRESMHCVITSFDKINYLVSYIKEYCETMTERTYYENMLKDIIKKAIPEIDDIKFNTPKEDNDINPDYEGYNDYEDFHIDHDGVQLARTILTSDGVKLKDFGVFSLYDFIFNRSYILLSGEDCRDWKNTGTGTEKIDDETYFTDAFGLKDDCTLIENPNYYKEHNKEYTSDFKDHIKLELSCFDSEEKINNLEEK